MILGFLTTLIGCAEDPAKHGDWMSFHMNKTSSVLTEAYHFGVTREVDGKLAMTGYCYEGDSEFRAEGIYLPYEIKLALDELQPEKLPSAGKKFSLAGQKLDGANRTETVTHEDGTERTVRLNEEQRSVLTGLFTDALKAAVQSASHGEWEVLYLRFSNDNYSEGYDFEIRKAADAEWISNGFCSVMDDANDWYVRYESEEGITLSSDTVDAIRALGIERYPAMRPMESDMDAEILDGSSGGMVLVYADGYTERKATDSAVDNTIADLLKAEFAQKAEPQ